MLLTNFLHDLLTTGVLTLAGQPAPFTLADQQAAEIQLREFYAQDALSWPHTVPPFEAVAAGWAAAFVYRTAQLALVRELDEEVIREQLRDWPGTLTPAVVYAADLTFRYLPDLLALARGLAPGDALVAHLRATARRWPLSFVGADATEADPAAEAVVLDHPALRQGYVDRLIARQQRERARQPHLRPLVQAALGAHAATLWPAFAEAEVANAVI